jgi:Flp pilus assembly protein TadD
MDRLEDALTAYRKSLGIEPTSMAHSNLGTTEFYLGQYAEASRDFEKAVALTPERYDGWADLADAYYWSGQRGMARIAYERAIRLARSDLQINARNPSARARLAVCLARTGDRASAREQIGQALALSQQDPRLFYDAAIVASMAGDGEQAWNWIARAVDAGYPIVQLRHEPQFASLRKDPKFPQTLQRKPVKK